MSETVSKLFKEKLCKQGTSCFIKEPMIRVTAYNKTKCDSKNISGLRKIKIPEQSVEVLRNQFVL